MRIVRERQNIEAKQRARQLKAERDAEEKEKKQQPLSDPIIKDDEEIKIRTEKEEKNKGKERDKPNNGKKKDKENRRNDDKK